MKAFLLLLKQSDKYVTSIALQKPRTVTALLFYMFLRKKNVLLKHTVHSFVKHTAVLEECEGRGCGGDGGVKVPATHENWILSIHVKAW